MQYLLIKVHEICENSKRVLSSKLNVYMGNDVIYETEYIAPESETDTYGEDIDIVTAEGLEEHPIELKFMALSSEFKLQLNRIEGGDFRVFEQAGSEGKYRVCVEIFFNKVSDNIPDRKIDINRGLWKVIGHRGFGANKLMRSNTLQVEENTNLSISSAYKFGLQAVEIDVQRLVDGSLVVYHDEDIHVHGVKIPLSALNLQQFLALSKEFNKPTTPVIEDFAVMLSELLAQVPSSKGINIELKMYVKKGPESRLREMHEYCTSVYQHVVASETKNVIFSSFDITLCIMMQLVQTRFPMLFIIPEFGTCFEKIERCLNRHKFSGLVMTANQALYFAEKIGKLKKMGLYCFTYQQPENTKLITKQLEYGVDGMIIDDPRRYQWLLPLPSS